MTGKDPAMCEAFTAIRQAASCDYPVLITGETGTGKELAARAIHNESRRCTGPFVPINCGALPDDILESELFGHVRGAFSGAIRDKKGRIELADRGTLLLDEVGELSPAFQVKLLRVLEEKRFVRVGGERPIDLDFRVICATNRDLRRMKIEECFRDDLFYRLSVLPIRLPPLRQRPGDIPLLIEHILTEVRKETDSPALSMTEDTMNLLCIYPWPGNVRELKNVLRFASVRCGGTQILPRHLPPEVCLESASRPTAQQRSAPLPGASPPGRHKLASSAVEEALSETKGNKAKAAKLLGVGRATLYRFLDRHPVPLPESATA
jgi:transcriptional regulator with PAS, ATPase and Fis domain